MYLALCYFGLSLGFLLRVALGHKVSIINPGGHKPGAGGVLPDQRTGPAPSAANRLVARQGDLAWAAGGLPCALVFSITYYCTMAASV